MKRTPLKRRTPLDRSKKKERKRKATAKKKAPPKRKKRKPIKAVNRERKQKRQDDGLVYGEYHRFVATQPCSGAARPDHECGFMPWVGRTSIEADHIRTVGAGGKDYGNEWPLCPVLHDLRHAHGVAHVEALIDVRAADKALEIQEKYDGLAH